MADIRTHIHNLIHLLRRPRIIHKLALNRLSLRLRRYLSIDHLPSPPRPQTIHHRRFHPAFGWQLDPVWRYQGQHVQCSYGRADIDGVGAAVCAGGADKV